MSEQEPASEQFTQSFAKVLNRHGYGFQFSVLKKADELRKQGRSMWRLEACEFPVEVQGAGTRVDFVLERGDHGSRRRPLYMLAECKRANPALSNWCFVRAHTLIAVRGGIRLTESLRSASCARRTVV
jgi:hypothetical protein